MKIFIERPIATATFFMAVLLLGIYSFLNLPFEFMPKEEYPRVTHLYPMERRASRDHPGSGHSSARRSGGQGQRGDQDHFFFPDEQLIDYLGV